MTLQMHRLMHAHYKVEVTAPTPSDMGNFRN